MILRFSLDTWSDIDYKTELQKQKFNSPGLSKYCQKRKKNGIPFLPQVQLFYDVLIKLHDKSLSLIFDNDLILILHDLHNPKISFTYW